MHPRTSFPALLVILVEQVAEMHGELIEFNEVLQRQLVGREQQLRQLRAELVSLRGPVSAMIVCLIHVVILISEF